MSYFDQGLHQQETGVSKKQKCLHHSLLPTLHSLPLSLDDIAPDVAALLTSAAETLTKPAADAAREATFEYLQADDLSVAELYTPVYAAAQLFYAQSCYHEALELLPSQLMAPDTSVTFSSELRSDILQALDACLRAVDLALLRTSIGDWSRIARPLLQHTETLRSQVQLSATKESYALPSTFSSGGRAAPAIPSYFLQDTDHGEEVPRVDASHMSADEFLSTYMTTSSPPSPVILLNVISTWPALHKWSSMEYLKQKAAGRLVPVETYEKKDATQTYLTDTWEQQVMSFGDFVDKYVVNASDDCEAGSEADDDDDDGEWEDDDADDEEEEEEEEVKVCAGGEEDSREEGGEKERGYLAQYQLFEQIPSLMCDITVPSFCSARTLQDAAAPPNSESTPPSSPLVSAWFGPKGTVSPLHNDPYHNLLAQVVGSKYLRLYRAEDTHLVYPREGPLCNNSHINLDTILRSKTESDMFPRFREAKFQHCVLRPGEVLYIPRHYWHYVRSLEMSFSTSFWWGAKMGLQRVTEGCHEGGGEQYVACY